MKLSDFLLHKTRAEELCVICDPWICATVYIDHEDLFIGCLKRQLLDMEVLGDKWDWLRCCDQNGKSIKVNAHFIYIGE